MKGRGQWANRVLDDSDIERTLEYEEFMKKLQAYHDERGTVLTPEPELGRKKLDLLKLYKRVTEAGGYDHLTEGKGAWRDLAQSYRLVANNTNAGYLLKTIYYKNLAAYEIRTFHGLEPPPKDLVEDRSAAGGPIMGRTFENTPPEGTPGTEAKEEEMSMSPQAANATPMTTSSGRTLRQAPPQRQFYQPPISTPRATSKTATAGPSQAQQPQQSQPATQSPSQHANGVTSTTAPQSTWTPPNSVPAHYSGTSSGPIPRPVMNPAHNPPAWVNQRQMTALPLRGPKPGTGHTGPSTMTRITMGLRSGLPDEVAWALTNLAKTSFDYEDNLKADDYPGMTEALVSIFSGLMDFTRGSAKQTDTIETPESRKKLDKILEAALILRNMSFNVDNAQYIANIKLCRDTLVEGIQIPSHSPLTELKHYCLDIVECLCQDIIPLAQNKELFKGLADCLESDDRGIIITALRGITRLVYKDETNWIRSVDIRSVCRVQDMLLLADEELLLACLDFLYQYTVVDENVVVLMTQPNSLSFLKQLRMLLLYQAEDEYLSYSLRSKMKAPIPVQLPHLPQEIVSELLSFPEPERATKWMRCSFTADPEADITQIVLWQAYQARFTPYINIRPLLPAAEFIKNVSVAFSTASAMVIPQLPTQKFIIKGIKPRLTPLSPSGVGYLACQWMVGPDQQPGNITGRCQAMLPSPQDLFAHILNVHLSPPSPEEKANFPVCCAWAECHRFPPPGSLDRRSVIAHVRTHMPDPPKTDIKREQSASTDSKANSGSPHIIGIRVNNPVNTCIPSDPDDYLPPSETLTIRNRCTATDEQGDAAGVALTAALVLRNIARSSGVGGKIVSDYFRGGLENDCHEVAVQNQPLAQYIYDFLMERYEEDELEAAGERRRAGLV